MRLKPKYLDRERREVRKDREFVQRLGTGRLSPTLRKDLTWAVKEEVRQVMLKCLAKESERRHHRPANENS